MKKYNKKIAHGLMACSLLVPLAAEAVTLEELAEKLESLEQENAELKERLDSLESSPGVAVTESMTDINETNVEQDAGLVSFNHNYSYDILDPTRNIRNKPRFILDARESGILDSESFVLSGAVTAIANAQRSNTDSKFGYLMRHPTSANQQTKNVSEAVVHSAQIAATATVNDWTSAYIEMLYDPEQSFGPGTNTALARNQVQVRKAFVILGNLDHSPGYLALGKMAIPFGLTDTVSPFTASTVWHAFGGLAYGANLGYAGENLNINAMAVQGGAQFRAANVPVNGTNVPSKLNNFAFDINYSFGSTEQTEVLLGASYIKGSAYCQSFPVTHFSPCNEENAAYDVYTKMTGENWIIQAEYAETTDLWPGTFNPSLPQFAAHDVNSWMLGGAYNFIRESNDVEVSLEISRFTAGPSGSPWEYQDQTVLGVSTFISDSVKLFGEYIHTRGYVPLNFITGGNFADPAETHSTNSANSDILMFGANVAF